MVGECFVGDDLFGFFFGDGFFFIFVGMGVGVGVLIMNWKFVVVMMVLVGVNFDFVVDVSSYFMVKVIFDVVVGFNVVM